MPDIRIDLDQVSAMRRRIVVAADELGDTAPFGGDIDDLAGHDRLATAVREFADRWNIQRSDLLDELTRLAAAATTIAETFEEVDAKLAAAADPRGDPAPSKPAPSNPA